MPTSTGRDLAAVQRRTVGVLSLSQGFAAVGVASGIAVGTLLAAEVSRSDALAGLPQTGTVLGAALAAVPLSRLMTARGRRIGLMTGYGLAVVGAVVVIAAAVLSARETPSTVAFPLLLLGMFLFGTATAAGLQARFAAMDLAVPERRGSALSIVVWSGTIGAVLGPNLAEPGGVVAERLGMPALAGPFVFSIVGFLVSVTVLSVLLRPDPLLLARQLAGVPLAGDPDRVDAARTSTPLRATLELIGRTPAAVLGLLAVAVAHTAMIAVMVMTPIHMDHGGAQLRVIGLVISVHVAGMYAFSPVVGWLVDAAGRIRMIVAGAILLLLSAVVAGLAPSHASAQLGIGLFLLGLGWSCCLVAGSTLLSESVPVETRPAVQGASDLVMGLCAAVGGALSGVVLGAFGFGPLNLLAAILVVGLLVAVTVSRGSRSEVRSEVRPDVSGPAAGR
ncbi:MAG TPA: MFS transporter [Actinomycetes bacterium]|nr:MFS transporter [Actinomycetes bacterium]